MSTRRSRSREGGQILVLFALSITALIAMAGLVLDGGGTFAQRREQQAAADMAAMAGANAYMNHGGSPSAKRTAAASAAQAASTVNGYTNGGSTQVNVTVSLVSSGATVQVDITHPHENGFARIFGATTWPVTVTATAVAGTVDTGIGAAPWTMSIDAFNPNGTPKYTSAHDFNEINNDYPISGSDLAWTDFNGADNVNANEVKSMVRGEHIVTATMDYGQYLGQHNNGNMTTVYPLVNSYLAGKNVPVPIVGPGNPNCTPPTQMYDNGCFKGWALFHVVSASGGSTKRITGYFLSDFISLPLTVGECTPAQQAAGTCGVISESPFGAYVVRLTN